MLNARLINRLCDSDFQKVKTGFTAENLELEASSLPKNQDFRAWSRWILLIELCSSLWLVIKRQNSIFR